ncbi:leucine-rich repeat neuronal protein 1-like [Euwallacea fornicatus]|uniref:leucine-rich repeat neuronal protein 1-like n=1 Tax=Euwallacea fornicatus TaxID=995702 RepID=UPI00338DD957
MSSFRLPHLLIGVLLPTLLLAEKSLLCSEKCVCTYNDGSQTIKVTCTKNVQALLLDNSSWIDPNTKLLYEYTEVTLTNQNFIKLNFTFPKNNLTYLNLANNDIYSITDSVFQNLQNMRVLILSNNDLELLSVDAFKGLYLEGRFDPLRSLIELRLDHNKLHTLNKDIFEHIDDLEILDLSYNPLKVIDLPTTMAIDTLASLKELYLRYTQITTLPTYILNAPKHLFLLDLSGNPISVVPSTLSDSHNLTTLYLNDTAFVNLTEKNGFPQIPTIKTLYLSNLAYLERIDIGALSGLTGLEELHISDNIKLNYISEYSVASKNEKNRARIWPQIRKLYLQNNKLSYLKSDFIIRWDSLTELDIRDNPWTCECENQWMVEDLMPNYMKIDPSTVSEVKCGAPVEMASYTLFELYEKKYEMRCLDIYGAKPDKDAVLLIGVLTGVLLAIPIILFIIFAFQRRWFGVFTSCSNSPAAYSRRFYSATKDDDF